MKTSNYLFNPAIAVLALLSSLLTFGQNVTTPRLSSPAAQLKQTIGLTEITIDYSRPKLTTNGGMDRSGQIWGQLVPYGFTKTPFGNQGEIPWRAGANENTVITFSDDVTVQGQALEAGSYGLHMALKEDGAVTLIFSDNTSSWGSYFYDDSEDVLRVDTMSKSSERTEVLTYELTNYGVDFAVISLKWDNKEIPMKIGVNTHEVVLQNFRDELRSLPGFGWIGFQTAANYCLTNNVNLEEGLIWAETAAQRNGNFQTLTTKAGLQMAMGDVAAANATFDSASSNASVAQINALGYQLLGAKQYQKAIEYFELNVKNAPENANCYDSLGDGYKAIGEKKKAIKNYKKALTLNPPANVKAASEASLKELGAL